MACISTPAARMGTSAITEIGAGATGAAGALLSGQAQKGSAGYNAAIAEGTEAQAKQNAEVAMSAGEEQAARSGLKTRAELGSIKANQAAGNIDVNSGSALAVQQSAAELGRLDAQTIRSNAAREAYTYVTKAASEKAQAELDLAAGDNADKAGKINAASTLLGDVGKAGANYTRYQMMNAPMTAPGDSLHDSPGTF